MGKKSSGSSSWHAPCGIQAGESPEKRDDGMASLSGPELDGRNTCCGSRRSRSG
jgi:hypothetical protein